MSKRDGRVAVEDEESHSGGGENHVSAPNHDVIGSIEEMLRLHQQDISKQLTTFLAEMKKIMSSSSPKDAMQTPPTLPLMPTVKCNPNLNFHTAPQNKAARLSLDKRSLINVPHSAEHVKERKLGGANLHKVKRRLINSPDPNFPTYDHSSVMAFEKWYNSSINDHNRRYEALTVVSNGSSLVDPRWFKCIWEDGRVEAEHMDALATLVANEEEEAGADSSRGTKQWTWIPAKTWDVLSGDDFTDVPACSWSFVTGSERRGGCIAWRTSTTVIGFGLVGKAWICYEASFLQQRITIHDFALLYWGTVTSAFENLSKHIPRMCKLGRIWEAHGFKDSLRDVWNIVPYPKPPVAQQTYDCGILALKVMQSIARGAPVSEIIGSRCPQFRRHFCGALYSKGKNIHQRAL